MKPLNFVAIFAVSLMPQDQYPGKPQPIISDENMQVFANSQKMINNAAHDQRELAKFGSELFFNTELSKNGSVSCATCHIPEHSFSEPRKIPVGQTLGSFNTPPILNLKSSQWLFWNGRSPTLENQTTGPFLSDAEHGLSLTQLNSIVLNSPRLRESFAKVFPKLYKKVEGQILNVMASPSPQNQTLTTKLYSFLLTSLTKKEAEQLFHRAAAEDQPPFEYTKKIFESIQTPIDQQRWFENWGALKPQQKNLQLEIVAAIASALAAFQNGIFTLPSKFDLWAQDSDQNNMSQDEIAGYRLFLGKGNCISCHHGPNFSDGQFHNLGLEKRGMNNLRNKIGRALGLEIALQSMELWCQEGGTTCTELAWLDRDNIDNVGAFKTPTLRNLSSTAPYFHTGAAKTIREVLEFYNQGPPEKHFGEASELLGPLHLKPFELNQLEAFLKTLQSDVYVAAWGKSIEQIKPDGGEGK